MGVIIRPIKEDRVNLTAKYRNKLTNKRNQTKRNQPIKKDTRNEIGGIMEFKARHPY